MCKECKGHKEFKEYRIPYVANGDRLYYNSFDELTDDLKDKFKSDATRLCIYNKSKKAYVDFINKLNENGDKLVSDYIGAKTKVRIHYGKCRHIHPEGEGITPNNYKTRRGCSICNGCIVVKGVNDLATTHPKLAKEWHPTKNGDLKPTQVSSGTNKKVWWQCEQGHEWEALICGRTNMNSNCSYCSNRRALKGYNDIATTDPDLIKYFPNIEDAYTHTRGSNDKVEMKCPICGTIKVMSIYTLVRQGFGCPNCGDGISYSEKLMALVLEKLGIEFTRQLTYNNGKHKYDFYIALWKAIFETHGIQHYEGWCGDKEDLLRQEANDENKRYDAIHSLNLGIRNEDYHEIDCRYSTLEWCRPNIEKALSKYIDISILTDEDWKEFDKEAQKSLKIKACLYWKEQKEINKDLTPSIVAEMFNVDKTTIISWLNWGNGSGLCTYNGKEEREAKNKRQSKFVYLIKPNETKEYDKAMNQSELSRLTGIKRDTISKHRRDGKPLNGHTSKYDSKYIGCYIVNADEWDAQHN